MRTAILRNSGSPLAVRQRTAGSDWVPQQRRAASRVEVLGQLSRGALTVARRRCIGFFGYLLTKVAWPQLLYRRAWGNGALPVAQGLFAAWTKLRGGRPSTGELRRLGLLAGASVMSAASDAEPAAIEALMGRAHAAHITGVAGNLRDIVQCDDGSIRFRELARARSHPPGSARFVASRDADRRAFNRTFAASILTEESARLSLQALKKRVPDDSQGGGQQRRPRAPGQRRHRQSPGQDSHPAQADARQRL
jgi:hypothetical protein